jgi:pyroglutamyl-peptidase
MTRVVLTSFEPFGSHTANSSLEVGRLLARRPPPGVDLDWAVLPVVAGQCVEQAWARVEQAEPRLVLALGQAAGARALRVEARAVNVNDFRMGENAGTVLRNEPIVPHGPANYRTTTPARHIARRLAWRGIAVEMSGSAGTYVCNHLYYGLLHRAAEAGCNHQTGFIHLPLFAGQAARDEATAERSLEELAEGIRLAITACLEAGTAE